MNPRLNLELLGGMTPAEFMRCHWQREPKLIRQAIPAFKSPIGLASLKRLAKRDDVESRLIWREDGAWQMEHGPFARLPKANEPDWTLLVQSVDLHDDAVAELMHRFRFVPDARLDDIMISLASPGGGVGPHFDSYDVFLLQAQGTRRWSIGRQRDLSLQAGLPLKVLRRFEPETQYVLEPGDMLYLPPHVAHDGVAVSGDCMTISIGFRAPTHSDLARGMLETAAEQIMAPAQAVAFGGAARALAGLGRYRDPEQPAVETPAQLPDRLLRATLAAVKRVRLDEALATRYLGCWLTEPGPNTVFDPNDQGADENALAGWPESGRIKLDRRTRLLYRGAQLFVNGELAPVRANALLRRLADERALDARPMRRRPLPADVLAMLAEWVRAGWLHVHAGPGV